MNGMYNWLYHLIYRENDELKKRTQMMINKKINFHPFSSHHFNQQQQSVIQNGQENCLELIEAHKKCMRDLGFNI